jgi:hypothetical protein
LPKPGSGPAYITLLTLFEKFTKGGPAYARWRHITASSTQDEYALMEQSPEMFQGVDIDLAVPALEVSKVKEAYERQKSGRATGKIVLLQGEQKR